MGEPTAHTDSGENPEQVPSAAQRQGVGIPLGRWAGVPVRAHWSVALALALFAEIVATSVLPAADPGESTAAYWLTGSITAAVFLATLLAHELAHAVTARHYRMRVHKITLWVLGGMTELDGDPPSARADALIAAAGPLTSLAIGAGCAGLVRAIGGSGLVVTALAWLAGVNVLLGIFNLLPGAPLDGGRLLRALLWWRSHDRARARERAAAAGRALGIILIGLGLLEVLAGGPGGLWLALIGWFILGSATGEQSAVHADQLRHLTLREVMTEHPAVAADWWTVQHFLDQLEPDRAAQAIFPTVDFTGQISGTVTIQSLARIPADQRATTRLRELGQTHVPCVAPDTPLPAVIQSLRGRGAAIVAEDGRPIGIITQTDLARAAQLAHIGWRSAPPDSRRDSS